MDARFDNIFALYAIKLTVNPSLFKGIDQVSESAASSFFLT